MPDPLTRHDGLDHVESALAPVDDRTIVKLAEETLDVSKREVEGGAVRVHVRTETFEDVARATLEQGRVEITHVPVNEAVERMPDVRVEGDTTIFPVMEERLVIEKRLFLKEEVHVRRLVELQTVEEPITLRRQHATVERTDAAGLAVEATPEGTP